MELHKKKKEIANLALKSWSENNFNSSIEMATGTGKTYVGVVAACEFIRRSVGKETSLIVVKQVPHIEHWKKEIIKWKYEDVIDNITIMCIASACKLDNVSYDTIVVDEAHGSFGEKYSKIYSIPHHRTILLSATFNANQRRTLKAWGYPVSFKYNLNQAEKDGLVEKATRFILTLPMSTKEANDYVKANNKILSFCINNGSEDEESMEFRISRINNHAVKGMWYKLKSLRSSISECTVAKVEAIKEFVTTVIDKTIIMSGTIDFITALYGELVKIPTLNCRLYIYHSKHKTAKARGKELEGFYKDPLGILLTVQAADEGLDDAEVSYELIVAGTRSPRQKTQREGRTVRLGAEGKQPVIINLCAYKTHELSYINSSYKGRAVELIEVQSMKTLIEIVNENRRNNRQT